MTQRVNQQVPEKVPTDGVVNGEIDTPKHKNPSPNQSEEYDVNRSNN